MSGTNQTRPAPPVALVLRTVNAEERLVFEDLGREGLKLTAVGSQAKMTMRLDAAAAVKLRLFLNGHSR